MVQFLLARGDAISVIGFIVIVLAGLLENWSGGTLMRLPQPVVLHQRRV